MKKRLIFSGIIFLFLLTFSLTAQTPPDKFLGHKVGEDRNLADYTQIQDYFQKLDQESEKISVLTIGESTLGKPMIMAVITSEANMADLEKYRNITKK